MCGSGSQSLCLDYVGGLIPRGNYSGILDFCLDNIDDPAKSPQKILVEYFTVNQLNNQDSLACTDTLTFNCDPIVDNNCVEVTDQSITCIPDSNKYRYTFTVTNRSTIPFSATAVFVGIVSPSDLSFTPTGGIFPFTTPLGPNQSETISSCLVSSGGFPNSAPDIILSYRLFYAGGDTCCFESVLDTIQMPDCCEQSTECIDISNIEVENIMCDTSDCFDDPFCQSWVRNLLSGYAHGCPGVSGASMDVATWNGQTVILFRTVNLDSGTNDIYDCQGNLIQACAFSVPPPPTPCNPDAGINITTDLSNVTRIWDCGDPIPTYDPSCLSGHNKVRYCMEVTNHTGGPIHRMDLDEISGLPVLISPDPVVFIPALDPDSTRRICFDANGNIGVGDTIKLVTTTHDTVDDMCCTDLDTLCLIVPPCRIDSCPDFTCDSLSIDTMRIGSGPEFCCYNFNIENNYCEDFFKGLKVSVNPPAHISSVITYSGWIINQLDPYHAEVFPAGGTKVPTGQHLPFAVCNNSTSDYLVQVSWLVEIDQDSCLEICPEEILIPSCPDDFTCYEIVDDTIHCKTNTYCFKIKNTSNPAFDLYSIHLYGISSGASFSPSGRIPIPNAPLSSGQISDWICVTYSGVNPGDTVCHKISAHNTLPGTPPTQCCTDTFENCFVVPDCPTCCADSTRFCDLVDLGFQVSTDGCTVTVDAPQFDSCHWFGTLGPDWGDGSVTLPAVTPAPGAGPWSHTYATPGTHNICITVFEGESIDDFCWSKEMCTTVELNCCPDFHCDSVNIFINKDQSSTDSCCFVATIENNAPCQDYFKGIKVTANSATISQVAALPGFYINHISPTEAEVYPLSSIGSGIFDIFRICNENYSGSFSLSVSWLVDDGIGGCDELCSEDFDLNCGIKDPNNCIDIITDTLICDINQYCFTIKNNTSPAFNIRSVTLHNVSPAGRIVPLVLSVNPALPYGMTRDLCVSYVASNPGDTLCFTLVGHDTDLNSDPHPATCCADTQTHCFVVPSCCGDLSCDDLDISVIADPIFTDSCCFIGSIDNGYCDAYFKGIKVEASSSTISQIMAMSGWYVNQISPLEAELYPTGSIGLGVQDVFRICNENTAGPLTIEVSWLVDDGNGGCDEWCMEEFSFTCDIKGPNRCLNIISDTVICENDKYCFTIKNNSYPTFDIKSVVLHNISPAGSLSPIVISLGTPLPPGQQRELCVDYFGATGDNICFTLVGHDEDLAQNPYPTTCCADTQVHCFTIPDCTPCCTDYDAFCDLVDLGFDMQADSGVVTVSLSQFGACHWLMTDGPDWGDGTTPSPGPVSAAGNPSWSHRYDSSGMYTICLDVYESDDGDSSCWQKTICKMVLVVCPPPPPRCRQSQMNIPNGFTPNGDGLNDLLVIEGPNECYPIDIVIYNRWGQIVWEQNDYDNTWDGRSKNGEQLPDGTYFMTVEFYRTDNEAAEYKVYKSFLDIRSN